MIAFLRRYSLALRWVAFAVLSVVIVHGLEEANDKLSETARRETQLNRRIARDNNALLEQLRCLQRGTRRDVDLILATLKELANRAGISTEDLPTRRELERRLEDHGLIPAESSDRGDDHGPGDPDPTHRPTHGPSPRPTKSPSPKPTKSPRPTPSKGPVEELIECVSGGQVLECVDPVAAERISENEPNCERPRRSKR